MRLKGAPSRTSHCVTSKCTPSPLISALVIGKDENMPSSGFWTLCRELGIAVTDRQLFWLREAKACCEFYGRRAATW